MPILSIKNITKKFESLSAVSDISVDVEKGNIVSLIGPNGAGKNNLFNPIKHKLAGVIARSKAVPD